MFYALRPCGPWESGSFCSLGLWLLALGEAGHNVRSQTILRPPWCEEAQASHTRRPHGKSFLNHTRPATSCSCHPNLAARCVGMKKHLEVDPLAPATSADAMWIRDQLLGWTPSKFLTHKTASKINVCFISLSFGEHPHAAIESKNNFSFCFHYEDIYWYIYQYIPMLITIPAPSPRNAQLSSLLSFLRCLDQLYL